MPYSRRTYSNARYIVNQPDTLITTGFKSYWRRLRPVITIYDNTETTALYTYNAFNPDATTDLTGGGRYHPLLDLSVTLGKNKNTISYTVLDPDRTWNRKILSEGNVVKVWAGKTSSKLMYLFKGYIKKMRPTHIGNTKRTMHFEGIGEKAITNDIKITFQRAASSLEFDEEFNVPRKPDSQMAAHILVKELLESHLVRVTDTRPLKDQLRLDLSGISTEVDIRILNVSFVNIDLSTALDFFAEVTGATWDIRDGVFIFQYSKFKNSGIVIKSRANQSSSDAADSTSYFTGQSWGYEESISRDDGFMSSTIVETTLATKAVANSTETGGSRFNLSALYGTSIAQQFTSLDARFTTIRLGLSRIGDPKGGVDDPENPVFLKGYIITDNNNTPRGSVIATFDVPYESLTADLTDVFINDIKVDPSNASPNTKYWLRLQPIGVGQGDTIRWHHDGNVAILGRYSAFANDNNEQNQPDWKISDRGPSYNFTVFSKIQRLQYYTNQDAIDRYNATDSSIDVTYLEDVESVGKLAQMELSVRSNPVRIYDANTVTVPSDRLFFPAETVQIIDPALGLDENENVEASTEEINYNWKAEEGFGLQTINLNVMGEYIYKIEDLPN